MKLLFVSHKESWPDPNSPSGYSTNGGFPFQMQAISQLFDETRLLITQPDLPRPANLIPLQGHNLSVRTLPSPGGGRWHKLKLIPWALKNLFVIWREMARADAVHAAVPGDVGSIGMMVAILQRKRLFVRHCGTFGEPVTISDRILLWILERIASQTRVVFATGGSDRPPSKKNPHISWIFSTTLSQAELDHTPSASPWTSDRPLRLITVCRLAEGKNVQSILRALPDVRKTVPNVHLDVLGDGEYRLMLEQLAHELQLGDVVTFHGNVDHARVLNLLSKAHLFVFPTNVKEGFPKAVLEALACELPVISTRVSVIPQLLKNGSGVLLDDTSSSAVTDAILNLLSHPERLAAMGRLAREAAQGYTLEAWGGQFRFRLEAVWGPLRSGAA